VEGSKHMIIVVTKPTVNHGTNLDCIQQGTSSGH
jgi:hypothetical protein